MIALVNKSRFQVHVLLVITIIVRKHDELQGKVHASLFIRVFEVLFEVIIASHHEFMIDL